MCDETGFVRPGHIQYVCTYYILAYFSFITILGGTLLMLYANHFKVLKMLVLR